MLDTIGWLYGKLVTGLIVVAGLLIVAAIGMVVVDVGLRASGYRPPGFTVAFVEYILLYFTLLSAPYLVRNKGHVLVDVLIQSIGGLPRLVIEKLVYLICISVSLIFAYMGWEIFIEGIRFGYVDERSVDIPYWALYVLFPGTFSMIAIEFLRLLLGFDSLYEKKQKLDSV